MFLGLLLFLICLSLWLNCCSTFVYYLLIETKYFCYLCFHSNYLCWPKKEKNPSQWSGDDITILPTWQMMIMIARSVMMIGCNGWPAFGFALKVNQLLVATAISEIFTRPPQHFRFYTSFMFGILNNQSCLYFSSFELIFRRAFPFSLNRSTVELRMTDPRRMKIHQ